MRDDDLGRLLREVSDLRKHLEAVEKRIGHLGAELRSDMRSEVDRTVARLMVVESHIEELRTSDRDLQDAVDTGEQELERVHVAAAALEEAVERARAETEERLRAEHAEAENRLRAEHAEAITALRQDLSETRKRQVRIAATIGLGSGAGLIEIIQAIARMIQ